MLKTLRFFVVMICLVAAGGPVVAQEDDTTPVSPVEAAELAQTCSEELDRIRQALDDAEADELDPLDDEDDPDLVEDDGSPQDNEGMAVVLLDMVNDQCDEAVEALFAIAEDPTYGEHATVQAWRLQMRRAMLQSRAGQCTESTRSLRTAILNHDLPVHMLHEFGTASEASFRCGGRAGNATLGQIYMSSSSPEFSSYSAGTATSEQEASTFGADCYGSVPMDPQYTLEVANEMTLTISATSYDGDLVMVVTDGDEVYCNDDYDGLNPGIARTFAPGTYSIYIGEWSSGTPVGTLFDMYVWPYETSGMGYGGYGSYTYPTYGSASIGPSYGSTTLSGATWGTSEAFTRFGTTCEGYIADSNPDFEIYVDSTSEAWVQVTGVAGSDLTLVVDGPSGTFCVDDGAGTNPVLHETLNYGTYQVWVGDKSGMSTGTSYGIQFSTYDPSTVLGT
ncbi:MAG: hypothetical protein KC561_07165, partial [Myxococcales bacterium]|nr:hypothetical protein [Myxococcales bacterium]